MRCGRYFGSAVFAVSGFDVGSVFAVVSPFFGSVDDPDFDVGAPLAATFAESAGFEVSEALLVSVVEPVSAGLASLSGFDAVPAACFAVSSEAAVDVLADDVSFAFAVSVFEPPRVSAKAATPPPTRRTPTIAPMIKPIGAPFFCGAE
jgi:hypothetical protein